MEIVYQLVAAGPQDTWNRTASIRSKNVFRSKEAAEAFIPEFSKLCTGSDLMDLDRVDKITIVELWLVD